ncbi:MAG TPA: hypothetical protein VJV78_25865, partial [Polyangiales bacterium]|nr:hypothetical protein [Polyangiales bacterium]
MSDERGRRRDTPTGMGPGRSGGSGQAPRGAGLSGNLPGGSRPGQERSLTPKGLSPVSVHNDPPARSKPVPAGYPPAEQSRVNVEPHAVRSPPPPPRGRTVADGFAITHQAEAPQSPSSRAPQPGSRPLEVSKPSLRLKLDGADPDYEGRAVRVPKRRAPLLLGILIMLAMLAGGSFLWIDAHGGVDNFVAQLQHLADGSSPAPTSAAVQQPPAADAPQQ